MINSSRRGKLDKLMEGYGNVSGLAEEDGMIADIPKNSITCNLKLKMVHYF
jgi:hypothetical protein